MKEKRWHKDMYTRPCRFTARACSADVMQLPNVCRCKADKDKADRLYEDNVELRRALRKYENLNTGKLGLGAVMLATTLSRATIFRLMREGSFPRPESRSSGNWWSQEQINEWINSRARLKDEANP